MGLHHESNGSEQVIKVSLIVLLTIQYNYESPRAQIRYHTMVMRVLWFGKDER